MSTLEQGRIIWAGLASSDGATKKRGPAVVVTATTEIVPGEPFAVVAATTKFTDPLPADQFLCPGIVMEMSVLNFVSQPWRFAVGSTRLWIRMSCITAV